MARETRIRPTTFSEFRNLEIRTAILPQPIQVFNE